ncbi:UDP-2,3-diacylglucosamine diphosphatase [Pontivivens ytuae]|uniref:UDP-2,3-diacylglucosamine diphosphatase n=1 Tax=Pontivivens ytuae TaxID=2789856 RepID=A0A7S9LUI3_9RHOB|nr:UDP-2,3-diacylglucosamine diphosphatase [Pontivivens ytuae]QPH55369.1 UDP-2,3-diacylglucosamine diphosphatase [Pontivivens ytuae]
MARYRTIFLSDIHLGTRGCQAELLLDFLNGNDAETIFLVGDIVDGWKLRRGWRWPQSHNDVVQALLEKSRKGTRILYIPGNHDEMVRSYYGVHFGGIEVVERADHVTASGLRLLVTHGDQFDAIVMHAKWLAHVGDRAYNAALWLNTWVNYTRRLWNGQYWSLSKWAKAQVKHATSYISEYETVLTDEARRGGYDGIVCGHIHSARIADMDGLLYVNTGDWVESCTAVIEREDGSLRLLDWAARHRRRQAVADAPRDSEGRRVKRRRTRQKEEA